MYTVLNAIFESFIHVTHELFSHIYVMVLLDFGRRCYSIRPVNLME